MATSSTVTILTSDGQKLDLLEETAREFGVIRNALDEANCTQPIPIEGDMKYLQLLLDPDKRNEIPTETYLLADRLNHNEYPTLLEELAKSLLNMKEPGKIRDRFGYLSDISTDEMTRVKLAITSDMGLKSLPLERSNQVGWSYNEHINFSEAGRWVIETLFSMRDFPSTLLEQLITEVSRLEEYRHLPNGAYELKGVLHRLSSPIKVGDVSIIAMKGFIIPLLLQDEVVWSKVMIDVYNPFVEIGRGTAICILLVLMAIVDFTQPIQNCPWESLRKCIRIRTNLKRWESRSQKLLCLENDPTMVRYSQGIAETKLYLAVYAISLLDDLDRAKEEVMKEFGQGGPESVRQITEVLHHLR